MIISGALSRSLRGMCKSVVGHSARVADHFQCASCAGLRASRGLRSARGPNLKHARMLARIDTRSLAAGRNIEEASTPLRPEIQSVGSLEVVLGPMFAGKTSVLLQRISHHEGLARKVIAVKSNKDTRYNSAHLTTHDGQSKACFAVAELSHVSHQFSDAYSNAEVIAIDEAQFFPDLKTFCEKAVEEDSKHVVVAGLDGDFRRQRFGQVLDLLPLADSVTKLAAKCPYCEADGKVVPAPFSLRIMADERQEVVGGAEKYAAVCREHFVKLSQSARHEDSAFSARL